MYYVYKINNFSDINLKFGHVIILMCIFEMHYLGTSQNYLSIHHLGLITHTYVLQCVRKCTYTVRKCKYSRTTTLHTFPVFGSPMCNSLKPQILTFGFIRRYFFSLPVFTLTLYITRININAEVCRRLPQSTK